MGRGPAIRGGLGGDGRFVLMEVGVMMGGEHRPTSPLLLTLAPSLGAGRNIEYY